MEGTAVWTVYPSAVPNVTNDPSRASVLIVTLLSNKWQFFVAGVNVHAVYMKCAEMMRTMSGWCVVAALKSDFSHPL